MINDDDLTAAEEEEEFTNIKKIEMFKINLWTSNWEWPSLKICLGCSEL